MNAPPAFEAFLLFEGEKKWVTMLLFAAIFANAVGEIRS